MTVARSTHARQTGISTNATNNDLANHHLGLEEQMQLFVNVSDSDLTAYNNNHHA
jgi:hypothetical protein